jgi:hypothetical protein
MGNGFCMGLYKYFAAMWMALLFCACIRGRPIPNDGLCDHDFVLARDVAYAIVVNMGIEIVAA